MPGAIVLRLAWLAGAALFVGLFAAYGAGDVIHAFAAIGIGILFPPLHRVLVISCDALAWRRVLAAEERPSLRTLLRFTWYGDAVDSLLPTAQVGGELVRAELLRRRGVAGARAGASVVVTLTTGTFAQILFALLGLGLLAASGGGGGRTIALALSGCAAGALLVAGFWAAQRRGLFATAARVLELLLGRGREGLLGGAVDLDVALAGMWREPRTILICTGWKLASWLLGTFEVWIALALLGAPIGLVEALIVESLIEAVRGAAFLVPSALGVQEAGLVLLGAAIGLPAEIALALSLVKRARELLVGLPGLALLSTLESLSPLGLPAKGATT